MRFGTAVILMLLAGGTYAEPTGLERAFDLPTHVSASPLGQPPPAGAEVSIPVPGAAWPGVVTLAAIIIARSYRRSRYPRRSSIFR